MCLTQLAFWNRIQGDALSWRYTSVSWISLSNVYEPVTHIDRIKRAGSATAYLPCMSPFEKQLSTMRNTEWVFKRKGQWETQSLVCFWNITSPTWQRFCQETVLCQSPIAFHPLGHRLSHSYPCTSLLVQRHANSSSWQPKTGRHLAINWMMCCGKRDIVQNEQETKVTLDTMVNSLVTTSPKEA